MEIKYLFHYKTYRHIGYFLNPIKLIDNIIFEDFQFI